MLNPKIRVRTILSSYKKLVHSIELAGQLKTLTLPKALRIQVSTALTSNFGMIDLVQYAW